MTLRITKIAAVLALVCLAVAIPASAMTVFTEFGGGKQIWMTADSFVARDAGQHFTQDLNAANNAGLPVYFFPKEPDASTQAEALDWWAQYEINQADAPSTWGSLEDTVWGFYTRTMKTSSADSIYGDNYDANFLIVNGDPTDLNKANPTDADWYAEIDPGKVTALNDRIQNGTGVQGHIGYSNWAWFSDSGGPDGRTEYDPRLISKQFGVYDGKVTFRLFEREAWIHQSETGAIVWASADYTPTDADFMTAFDLAAVPEPSSMAALLLGAPAMFFFARRRRS